MKVLRKDHRYELENFEPAREIGGIKEINCQTIQFIEKEPVAPGSTELKTVNNGTTNEEALAMLIDRLNGLQNKFPCRENGYALEHIETALLWLNKRTADRKARGVEGKQIK